MALNFEELHQIDLSQRDLVFGYFRQYEVMLHKSNQDNSFYLVPDLVIYITLSYYYMFEYFKLYPMIIHPSQDQTMITRGDDRHIWCNICYSSTEIYPIQSKSVYQWFIKLESVQGNMHIGFGSDYDSLDVFSLLDTESAYYVLSCFSGNLYGSGTKEVKRRDYIGYDEFKTGDIVCVEFSCNGNKSHIKYYLNNVDQEIAFSADEIKMDIAYRMAITLCDPGDCVTIIDFKYLPIIE